ncbi:MAG: dolichyl-diphosphooligosaccharide--protein glycosyltransferase subunit STT3 [Candidatus Omnitrophica bacterium]|nr:dolichyl-diphosphooligosaccharide--protein glycosyltransferase subunit STT3 [Candidatus Omnitrophota bacterium]
MNALSLHPLFITVLMILLLFSFCRSLGISYPGSFLAVSALCFSNTILTHTSFGWFDTDGYNVFFPVLILFTLSHAFRKDNRWHYFYLCLAGVFVGIYSGAWSVWWLPFYIIVAGLFVYTLRIIADDAKKQLKVGILRTSLSVLIFAGAAYGSVLIISGRTGLKQVFLLPFSIWSDRTNICLNGFWPNISAKIVELMPVHFSEIISWLGGRTVLLCTIGGIAGMFISKDYLKSYPERKLIVYTLFIWWVVTGVLSYFSRKFVLLLAIPVGIFYGKIYDWLDIFTTGLLAKVFSSQRKAAKIKTGILVSLFLAAVLLISAMHIRSERKVHLL